MLPSAAQPPAGACWNYSTSGKVVTAPLTASTAQGDTLYSVTTAGQVYALDQRFATPQFQYSCPGANKQSPPGTPLLLNSILYFGCSDEIFYALDTLLLRVVWQYPPVPTPTLTGKIKAAQTLGAFRGAPVTDGQQVYVYTESQGKSSVLALNAISGTLLWSAQVRVMWWVGGGWRGGY